MHNDVSLNNGIPLRGDIRICARDAETGEVVRTLEIRNTITYVALGALVKLLSQRTTTDLSALGVGTLRVGTGTTAPVRSDVGLGNQVGSVPLADGNKVETTTGTTYELKILATLEGGTNSDPFNGQVISEAGIYTVGGQLLARQIYPGIPKTTALVIDYDWRISFTA